MGDMAVSFLSRVAYFTLLSVVFLFSAVVLFFNIVVPVLTISVVTDVTPVLVMAGLACVMLLLAIVFALLWNKNISVRVYAPLCLVYAITEVFVNFECTGRNRIRKAVWNSISPIRQMMLLDLFLLAMVACLIELGMRLWVAVWNGLSKFVGGVKEIHPQKYHLGK